MRSVGADACFGQVEIFNPASEVLEHPTTRGKMEMLGQCTFFRPLGQRRSGSLHFGKNGQATFPVSNLPNGLHFLA
ncbi:MAG: hypothetical protein R2788_00520 [Saprospiraceae bacterium]